MVVKSGGKITLMAEEPSFLSVCQLAINVYDRGPISASSHLASGTSFIFLHGTPWIQQRITSYQAAEDGEDHDMNSSSNDAERH